MISIAIANYNRVDMTMESFSKVLDNDLIDEIIILDDYSDIELYSELWFKIEKINTNKILLYRNAENLGPFINKYRAVKKCKNEWVILLDCDNIIDNQYIDIITQIDKEDDVLYCPEVLFKLNKDGFKFSYNQFNNIVLDKTNIRKYIKIRECVACMNTGNYLVNRRMYMDVVETKYLQGVVDARLAKLDTFYFNYLWMSNGYRMKVVPGLGYEHRIHDGSYYLKNSKLLASIQKELVKLLNKWR